MPHSDHEDQQPRLPANRRKAQASLKLSYAALGMIPIIGALLASLAESAYPGPQPAADQEWFADLARRLSALEADRTIDVEALASDDRFQRVVRRIFIDVQKESEHTKRDAYKSTIVNYALGRTLDQSQEKRILNLLEEYSDLHIDMLNLMADPSKRFPNAGGGMMSSIPDMLARAFPQQNADALEEVYSCLTDDGMLDKIISYHMMMSGSGAYVSRISTLGQALLAIINMPPESR